MSCKYCNPETFPNGGIDVLTKKVKGKSGKWHERVDGRFVKCTGKKTQSKIEMAIENALVVSDTFDDILILAKTRSGVWAASSECSVTDLLVMLGNQLISLGLQQSSKPSSPLPLKVRRF